MDDARQHCHTSIFRFSLRRRRVLMMKSHFVDSKGHIERQGTTNIYRYINTKISCDSFLNKEDIF